MSATRSARVATSRNCWSVFSSCVPKITGSCMFHPRLKRAPNDYAPPGVLRRPGGATSTPQGGRLRTPPGLPPHEVHQDELAEGHRIGEIGLPAANRRNLLHELHETPVPC